MLFCFFFMAVIRLVAIVTDRTTHPGAGFDFNSVI